MKEDVQKFIENVDEQMQIVYRSIDIDNVEKAAKLIMNSEKQGGRVHVTGIGKPGHVASYIASLLSSTGTSAYELHGTEAVHGSSGQVKPGDVVICISNSGETSELLATVNTLINNGAHIISCTRNPESTLAKKSKVCLQAKVEKEGDSLNKPPRTSVLAEILVLQCLSVTLQEYKKLDLEQYLKWHPGGSLGQSIRDLRNVK